MAGRHHLMSSDCAENKLDYSQYKIIVKLDSIYNKGVYMFIYNKTFI